MSSPEVVRTPDVLDGEPRLAETDISVLEVWSYVRELEWSHTETACHLSVSEPQIRAAVDYCEANPEEIAAVQEARRDREAAMAADLDV
ncbi:MAG: protein of unknown function (DUF433) [halophilic archaeon J07HB67]|jgi:Protein of unknown function (DUF433).|nr:MAG: protein of unknown function (DUF433) [halophilic archaeon J07HB67]